MSDGHFIVEDDKGNYLYHRRNTGYQYVDRSCWGKEYNDARVFTQLAAARNSARQSNHNRKWKVVKVYLTDIEDYGWEK